MAGEFQVSSQLHVNRAARRPLTPTVPTPRWIHAPRSWLSLAHGRASPRSAPRRQVRLAASLAHARANTGPRSQAGTSGAAHRAHRSRPAGSRPNTGDVRTDRIVCTAELGIPCGVDGKSGSAAADRAGGTRASLSQARTRRQRRVESGPATKATSASQVFPMGQLRPQEVRAGTAAVRAPPQEGQNLASSWLRPLRRSLAHPLQ
jgi:hypothetical protein